ncbi:hypothetical protein HPB51_008107 [Rhipicephalus microplus]|uniref:E3 ubiquitin-protein ligase Topors n=1 Tax=Rhipicephalus microplus TaxID=6941 RepID=A0A9J6ENQ9_RHIMP|nr:hypothetical protein HPB51_008107 [Rhipicephalus microplus]
MASREVAMPSARTSAAGAAASDAPTVKPEAAKGNSDAPPSQPPLTKSPERPTSPEQSCAICLGPPENKSFTDSCFHTFCFSCLLEWSKVKAECPLCKQRFKSIVHNVRSFEDYDQYFVHDSSQTAAAVAMAAASSQTSALGSALLLAHHLVYSPMLLAFRSTRRPRPRPRQRSNLHRTSRIPRSGGRRTRPLSKLQTSSPETRRLHTRSRCHASSLDSGKHTLLPVARVVTPQVEILFSCFVSTDKTFTDYPAESLRALALTSVFS